ncbi:MAG TPA: hypothetical protein VIJ51_14275 [Solirubrobacteraceae bacterium]
MIPTGCPDVNQPCGHPELTQSGPALLDFFRGVGIVLVICAVGWAIWWLWQRGRVRMIRRQSEILHDAHQEAAVPPDRPAAKRRGRRRP